MIIRNISIVCQLTYCPLPSRVMVCTMRRASYGAGYS